MSGRIWYDERSAMNDQGVFSHAWWKESKEEVWRALWGVVKALRNEQQHTAKKNLHHNRLYGNMAVVGIDAYNYTQLEEPYEDRLTYNVVESAVDTIHADICSQKAKAMFLTDEGDYKAQRRAERLNRYTFGQLMHLDFWKDTSPNVIWDALVFGTGMPWVHAEHGRPAIERVFPHEIIVDDIDARERRPQMMLWHGLVNKDKLQQKYRDRGDKRAVKKIEEAKIVVMDNSTNLAVAQVEVVRGWHLRSSPSANDGRFVEACNMGVLEDTDWEKDYFPMPSLRYKPRRLGYWGKGVPEILSGAQLAINDLLWQIHEHLRLGGMKVFVKPGSGMNMAHLDNEIMGVIETLEPPFLADFASVPPDLVSQYHDEVQNAYSLVGVSVMAASSELPAGLTRPSGKALRIYSDKKSQRFVKFAQAVEDWTVEVNEQLIEVERDLQKDAEPYNILVPNDDGTAELLKWADVDMDRDKYVIQAFPTSFLSSTPASRIKDVQELVALEPTLQPYVLKLLDFPDLKAVTSLISATIDVAMKMIEHNSELTDKSAEKYMPPEPEMNLDLTVKLAQAYYLRAKLRNAKEQDLKYLLKFLKQARHMAKDAAQKLMQEEMAMQAGAMAPPGAPVAPPPGAAPGGAPAPVDVSVTNNMPPMPMGPGMPPMG